MQYSIRIEAPGKAEAVALAAERLDAVISRQPVHAPARGAILAVVTACVEHLADAPARGVEVNCGGFVTPGMSSVSIGCTASLIPRK